MENQYHFDLIARAISYIKEHYKEQPSLELIAEHINLSKFHFQRLFQKWAGISPKQFLQFITIEQAKKALLEGKSTLDTAFESGLSGNGRLHDLFIKVESCSPGAFKERGKGLEINYDMINTPFGQAIIAETAKGICNFSFVESGNEVLTILKEQYSNAIFNQKTGPNGELVKQYFLDWLQPKKKITLDLKGTPFQIQVWKALLSIPSSKFISYQDIANKIDAPKAVRAVGTAIGNNPIAYLIPCHRVIKQNGEIGQYRWNSERKTAIFAFENACLNPEKIIGKMA